MLCVVLCVRVCVHTHVCVQVCVLELRTNRTRTKTRACPPVSAISRYVLGVDKSRHCFPAKVLYKRGHAAYP